MRINTIIVCVLLTITALLASGCADLQGAIARTETWRNQAATVRDSIDEQLGVLESQRADLEPGSTAAGALDTQIALARARHSALDAAITRADQVLNEARDPSDGLTRLAREAAPWIPAPAQGPVVLGAALIATLLRSRQLKHTSTSIINSISHVLERDPQFRTLFEQHADTIRSIQTPGARKLVDQTTRKRPTPIPT